MQSGFKNVDLPGYSVWFQFGDKSESNGVEAAFSKVLSFSSRVLPVDTVHCFSLTLLYSQHPSVTGGWPAAPCLLLVLLPTWEWVAPEGKRQNPV